jgi:hypothetical protein
MALNQSQWVFLSPGGKCRTLTPRMCTNCKMRHAIDVKCDTEEPLSVPAVHRI